MQSIRVWLMLLPLGLAIAGCGGNSTSGMAEAPKPSPVGGSLIQLPGYAGQVAVKTELASPAKSKQRLMRIVAVFFEQDGSTPMNPPPTNVVFELEMLRTKTKAAETKIVALEADATTPNQFVSAPGIFPGGIAGKIRSNIGGQDIECSFSAR